MSNTLRITGLATGLDVDTMVKQLMQGEKAKVDKVKQDRQLIQWTQDLYRDIINDLTSFKNTYFDVLKSDKFILSANNLSGFDATSVDSASSTATPTATATAGAGAQAGIYSVVVNKIAKAATIEGGQINNNNVGTVTITDGYITNSEWSSKTIRFNVDGADFDITLSDFASNHTINDLVNDINSKINSNTSLKGKISVTVDGSDKIKFNVLGSNQVKISSTETDATFSGIEKDKVLVPNKNTKLSDLKGFTTDATFTFTLSYNGTSKDIIALGTDTIESLMTKINTATSGGAIAKYSELTGRFTVQTANTGANTSLSINTNLTFLGINTTTQYGQDSEVKITPPGGTEVTITKSTNTFTVDGITYSLQSADTNRTTKITVTSNPQKVFDKIKEFVDKYNEIIDKVNKKLSEKRVYDYKPLTDDQKKDMKEDEIKKWEDKAKEGLLKGDSILQNMVSNLRSAFYEAVEGAGVSLNEIGLSTSSDYTQKGKIIIDETKLKAAIQNNGEQVIKLFTKTSSIAYDSSKTYQGRTDRNKEEGIFQRIKDILDDNIRTTRNSFGKKGALLEKAGIKGDLTEFNNILYKQLQDKDKLISELNRKLADREDKYYRDFAKLESAMQKLNEQSTWLSTQLSSMGS
ncbi:Flagellar hook-associated protein 2 [Caloramator mitchellensis]|uniref:Flagellar hook-associated protein 2 n=1 Tax=Caloramator mitchellensis TaxID=908809 RepID=A0A0R3JR99_CALMK|nr:flagellar filament capping protein FliD [Caloramator mitchellensis]KRQ85985.1 Flagellar hook-associated protein 2 [Caloramator mitchellensis]